MPSINVISDSNISTLEVRMAPTIVIPEIAFAPDINGVCKVDGTLEMSSNPRKIESTKTNNKRISTGSTVLTSFFDH
jgi:hypothetical protein